MLAMLQISRAALNALGLFVLGCVTASGGDIVGWRTDSTGKYPSANPPTVWAKDKGIVWKTPLPSWSHATPVLAGAQYDMLSFYVWPESTLVKDLVIERNGNDESRMPNAKS